MKIFGRVISIVAKFTIRSAWRSLEKDLTSIYNHYHTFVKSEMSPILLMTLIVGEDHRFFKHNGVDLFAIVRAIWCTLVRKVWVGGSTIEQQLVRTVTRRYERTLRRKVKEILLASLVSRVIPKSEIPGVYLSVAYFGWQMNGIQQVCRRMGIKLGNIRLWEAASIVARLKYPEPQLAPQHTTQQINRRAKYVMKLVKKHYMLLKLDKKETEVHETLFDFGSLRSIN